MPNQPAPAISQMHSLSRAFDAMNKGLFNSTLPRVMFTFSRRKDTNGFYVPEVWSKYERTLAEISLNPDALTRSVKEIYATLAHEMCHHWQHVHGTPPRKGYHDTEWARCMCGIGLRPIRPNGDRSKMTGQKMTHEIIEGGRFELLVDSLPKSSLLEWFAAPLSSEKLAEKAAKQKVKYDCGSCGIAVWGKEGLRISCLECDQEMASDSDTPTT